jgi:hypothetical protein
MARFKYTLLGILMSAKLLEKRKKVLKTSALKSHLPPRETMEIYIARNDVNSYVNYIGSQYNDNKFATWANNTFRIDYEFYRQANGLTLSDHDCAIHFNEIGIMAGLICHSKQLENLGIQATYLMHEGKIYALYNDSLTPLNEFIKKKIYDLGFEGHHFNIREISTKLNPAQANYIFLFVGRYEHGYEIIHKIKQLSRKENVCVIFNDEALLNKSLDIIKLCLHNYVVFLSKEYGTDIIPTLQAYSKIKQSYKIKNLIKLQTKSDNELRNTIVDHLLKVDLNAFVPPENSNCYGLTYLTQQVDSFNLKLIDRFIEYLDLSKCYVAMTMFACQSIVFDKVIELITTNHLMFYTNNMYDDNSLNVNYPVHLLERVFGTVIINPPVPVPKPQSGRDVTILYACYCSDQTKYNVSIHNLKELSKITNMIYVIDNENYTNQWHLILKSYVLKYMPTAHYMSCTVNATLGTPYDLNKFGELLLHVPREKTITFVNDSVFIIGDIGNYFSFVDRNIDKYHLIGLTDSYEYKYHIQSYLFSINKELVLHFRDKFTALERDQKANLVAEINLLDGISSYTSIIKVDPKMKPKNIFYHDEVMSQYISDGTLPLVKLRTLTYDLPKGGIKNIRELGDHFKPGFYRDRNFDLRHMTDEEITKHFIDHGQYEARQWHNTTISDLRCIINTKYHKTV